jgi:tetratricopeptide (TPR) repeat protein
MKKTSTVVIVLAGLLLVSLESAADPRTIPGYPNDVRAYDAREVALLPRYCIYTQEFNTKVPGGNNRAEIDKWYRLQGPTFHHMHHYCWGLMRTNRALMLARTKAGRDRYLQEAIWDFDYVIERAPANFVLLPEILTKRGEHLIRLKRGPMAEPDLRHAIELKPDYWPPYVALSDHYKAQGDISSARALLKEALSHSPSAAPVQKRLSELNTTASKTKSKP